MSFTKKGQIFKGERRSFFRVSGSLSISLYFKRNMKGSRFQFLNQMVQSFSHIDTHVFTSHVGNVAELLFFEAGNIAISEARIAFWICFY